MITNPGYIKMILALPDKFFAGWEWNYGDARSTEPMKEVVRAMNKFKFKEPEDILNTHLR